MKSFWKLCFVGFFFSSGHGIWTAGFWLLSKHDKIEMVSFSTGATEVEEGPVVVERREFLPTYTGTSIQHSLDPKELACHQMSVGSVI